MLKMILPWANYLVFPYVHLFRKIIDGPRRGPRPIFKNMIPGGYTVLGAVVGSLRQLQGQCDHLETYS